MSYQWKQWQNELDAKLMLLNYYNPMQLNLVSTECTMIMIVNDNDCKGIIKLVPECRQYPWSNDTKWTYIILSYQACHAKKFLSKSDNPWKWKCIAEMRICVSLARKKIKKRWNAQSFKWQGQRCAHRDVHLTVELHLCDGHSIKAIGRLDDCATLGILIRFVAYFLTLYSNCRPMV